MFGVGLRLWDGPQSLMDETWDVFRSKASPSGALITGAIVSYGIMHNPRLPQPYELELGGYIGFYSVENDDLDRYSEPGIGDFIASNIGSAFSVTQRSLISREGVQDPNKQWCLSGQTTIALQQQVSLLTSVTLGISNEQYPWLYRHTLGLNLSY